MTEEEKREKYNGIVDNPRDFAELHWGVYQTSLEDEAKGAAIRHRINTYTGDIPQDAQDSIAVAVDIFGNDKGVTPPVVADALLRAGIAESQYLTKIQYGGGPARGYMQVEPETAFDLVQNASALFGDKFDSHFPGMLEQMQLEGDFDKDDPVRVKHLLYIQNWLATNEDLATTMAAAKYMRSHRVRAALTRLHAVDSASTVAGEIIQRLHSLTPPLDYVEEGEGSEEGGEGESAEVRAFREQGLRADGSEKGSGWLGVLKRPDGRVSTELSVQFTDVNGGDEIPALVPGLTKKEIDHLLNDGELTDAIKEKIIVHAEGRIAKGLSPFLQPNEERGIKSLPRYVR